MLCSAREMGLGTDHDGIIELPATMRRSARQGRRLGPRRSGFEIKDHAGTAPIAWCVAVSPAISPPPASANSPVDCDAAKSCRDIPGRSRSIRHAPRLPARWWRDAISAAEERPVPQWLQGRLISIGLRPISALVDITNFVTFDLAGRCMSSMRTS